jgi:hypothetical protein
MIFDYTLKYGDKQLSWTEFNCNPLHKSRDVKIEYMLGMKDQKVIIHIEARPASTFFGDTRSAEAV